MMPHIDAAYYLAFYRGRGSSWDAMIRTLTKSQYSHVEIVRIMGNSPPQWLSSSPRDGGVRVKIFPAVKTNWDFVKITHEQKLIAVHLNWRRAEQEFLGAPYDWSGAFGAWVKNISNRLNNKKRWFCSELIAWILEWPTPERYTPQDIFDMALGHCLGDIATPDLPGMQWRTP